MAKISYNHTFVLAAEPVIVNTLLDYDCAYVDTVNGARWYISILGEPSSRQLTVFRLALSEHIIEEYSHTVEVLD